MTMTTTSNAAAPALAKRPRALPDALLATLGVAMLLMAVVLMFIGGESDTTRRPVVAAPVLELLAPLDGTTVEGPVELIFSTSRPITAHRDGWGVDDFHLHAHLDGKEVMPNAAEVTPLERGRYRWTVKLPAGPHAVRLYWAGPDHKPLPGGSDARRITVK